MTWLLHMVQFHTHFSICFHQCRLAPGMYALPICFPQRAFIFLSCWMFMVLLIGRRCFIACLTTPFLQCSCLCENKTKTRGGLLPLHLYPPSGEQPPKIDILKSPWGEREDGFHPAESFISRGFTSKKCWLLTLIISVRFSLFGGTV